MTVGSYGLSTMYLDFPVDIPYDDYEPDLLGIYYGYNIENNVVKLARLNSVIPANTGVVVHGNSGTYRFPKSSNKEYTLKYDNYLTGTTKAITPQEALEAAQSDGSVYTMQMGNKGYIAFYYFTGSKLAANKAFLIYDDSNAKELSIGIGGGSIATSIENAINEEEIEDTWYTLQGIPFIGKPSQRGVYIHNGKTISIK